MGLRPRVSILMLRSLLACIHLCQSRSLHVVHWPTYMLCPCSVSRVETTYSTLGYSGQTSGMLQQSEPKASATRYAILIPADRRTQALGTVKRGG